MAFKIEVNGIKQGEEVPVEFTCEGKNFSPEIRIKDAPSGTKSFAMIVEDPDAPVGLFVHWVIYNISPETTTIRGNIEKTARTKEGFLQGNNDFGRVGYDGPCPPKGHGYHRYFFKLYSLNSSLNINGPVIRERLLDAMKGKVLEQTESMGKYRR